MLAAAAALLLAAGGVSAADDEALDLISAPVEPEAATPRAVRVSIEAALGRADRRVAPKTQTLARASMDMVLSTRLAPGWKGVLSDRFDALDPAEPDSDSALNSLREAYVSWSDDAASLVAEAGRINMRLGPGYGYNPTDYFRVGALRAHTTANPIALRENRMGSVMLRGQHLWQGGSVSLAVAPKLADAPNGSTWSLDLGATNASDRGLLMFGLQASDRVNLQLLLFKDAGQTPQIGISGTALLSDAAVAHGEWSAGKEPSLADRAWGATGNTVLAQRYVFGLTYTTATKLSLTAEIQGNGFALRQDQWSATAAADPALAGRYLSAAQYRQDLPMRRALMLYVTQHDLLRKNLDLTAFVEYNPGDRSRVAWLELRQHWTRVDLALQVQANVGGANTVYGSVPERRNIQALLAYHFD